MRLPRWFRRTPDPPAPPEVRPDAVWQVAGRSRLQQQVEGESLEYPGLLATCPRGHVRALPSRFSRSEFPLRCHECGRDYPFRAPVS